MIWQKDRSKGRGQVWNWCHTMPCMHAWYRHTVGKKIEDTSTSHFQASKYYPWFDIINKNYSSIFLVCCHLSQIKVLRHAVKSWGQNLRSKPEVKSWGQNMRSSHEVKTWGQNLRSRHEVTSWGQNLRSGHEVKPEVSCWQSPVIWCVGQLAFHVTWCVGQRQLACLPNDKESQLLNLPLHKESQ